MLDDRADRERAKRAVTRRPVARPTGARSGPTLDRVSKTQRMGDAPHIENVGQVIETVQILQNQTDLAHEDWLLEVVLEVGVELGDKKRIVGGRGARKG